jgi:hypothetical protein
MDISVFEQLPYKRGLLVLLAGAVQQYEGQLLEMHPVGF